MIDYHLVSQFAFCFFNLKEQDSAGSDMETDNNESDDSSESKHATNNTPQTCCTNCLTACKLRTNSNVLRLFAISIYI